MRPLLMCWLLMVGSSVQAQEIEVFLKQGIEITGTEQAHEAGHSITYYFLDATQTIEQVLSNAFTKALKQQINEAENNPAINTDITQQIINQFNDRNNPETAIQLKAIVTEDIKAKLAKAWRDVIYAKGLNIKPEDLPVIRFKDVNHNNVSDLSLLFKEAN